MPDAAESSIVVDAWLVQDGSQDELLQGLEAMLERLAELDGFIEGAILQGVDRTRFVTFARMRSAAAREAALLDGEIRSIARGLAGVARPGPHTYSVVRRFAAPGLEEPAGS